MKIVPKPKKKENKTQNKKMANLPNCSSSKLLKNDNAEHNKQECPKTSDRGSRERHYLSNLMVAF